MPMWIRYVLLLAALGTTSCGFQLRGQNLDISRLQGPVEIVGIDRLSPLARELRIQLETVGTTVAEPGQPGVTQLVIGGRRTDSLVLSLDSRNKAVEYELIEAASFRFKGLGETEPTSAKSIVVRRVQYQPEGAVLGSGREEVFLREDMRRELAERIVQQAARTR